MPLNCGIVGLPNVGKSTIFNALTAAKAQAANYPFCTIDPNVGIVSVPDERLDRITAIFKPKSLVPTTMEFIDIAGLVAGASKGEGLGSQFLGHIRATDAIVHVVRCFDDPEVVHVAGGVNPLSDIDVINRELMLHVAKGDDAALTGGNAYTAQVEQRAAEAGSQVVRISGAMEAEIALLEPAERAEFLADMGPPEPGLNRLIHAGYRLLDLITYFTAGPDECRAWTIRPGTTCPGAAG